MPMTPDRLRELIAPGRTAVLTMELQQGVVGDRAILPALPIAVRDSGLLDVAGRVCTVARSIGVRVVHATFEERPDVGAHEPNTKVGALTAKYRAQAGFAPTDRGQPGVELAPELDAPPSDITVARMHGLTPFTGTELDAVMRSIGVRTIVLIGVSVNLGVIGAALSAVDLGYHVVIVRDAVIGLPREYGEAVLDNSLAMIATIVTSGELVAAWT